MANRSQKLSAFHGGLNDNSDSRDIAEDELASSIDLAINRIGRVGVIGSEGTALTNLASVDIKPLTGYGMFYFSTDRDKNGNLNSEDWIAIYNSADGKMQFYYRDKSSASPSPNLWTYVDAWINFSSYQPLAIPNFYIADGILRYSDGNFEAGNNNKVHYHVDNKLFQRSSANTTVDVTSVLTKYKDEITAPASAGYGNIVVGMTAVQNEFGNGLPSGTTVHTVDTSSDPHIVKLNQGVNQNAGFSGQNTTITAEVRFTLDNVVTRNAWVNREQELKSFDDLGVSMALDDSQSEGPDDTALGSTAGKIILSYWKGTGDDNGNWNGSFSFAASPIYKQGGVGPISEFDGITNFHNDMVSFQMHIAMGSTINATAHPFVDDRIEGVRVWFRSHGADKWHKLKDFDLKKGGKHRWETYDGNTNKAYGIFDGAISNPAVAESDRESYKEVNMTFTITNSAQGFSGRKGFIRVWGVYNEPQWLNTFNNNPIDLSSSSTAYTMVVTMPGNGDREFRVELLDESFNVIKKSSKTTITIGDSGDTPPPTYSDDTSSS